MANKQPKTPGEESLQDVRLMQLIYEAAPLAEQSKFSQLNPQVKKVKNYV
ncbi:hypothetical protein [Nostoc sp. MG11]|nr:hypothetical protein [Nostoc sp. MG11]